MKKKILFALGATAVMAAAQNIDDFEDGDGLASTGADDAWYAFTDVNDGGASSYSNTEDKYGLVVVIPEAAAGGSSYGAGLTDIVLDQGTNQYDPYVTLGLNVADGLSGCTTISYKYKGAGHNLKAVMSGDEKGALKVFNPIQPKIMEEPGNGIGLANLTERYRLKWDKNVEIVNDGRVFMVTLPLVEPQS